MTQTASIYLLTSPAADAAWQTAADDASRAPPGLGDVWFMTGGLADAERLAVTLPLPLDQGRTVALSMGEPSDLGAAALEMLPRAANDTNALVELDPCVVDPAKGAVTSCAPAATESVAGTVEVVEARPLQVHVEATVTSAGAAAPQTTLDADLSFSYKPLPCGGSIRID